MDIKVGRFHLRSDQYSIWVEEEYTGEDKHGKPKKQTRRVAGYTNNIDNLIRQFVAHKHRASEATTVKELIETMKQTAEDTVLLKKTAVANDLKAMRRIAKEVDKINKESDK